MKWFDSKSKRARQRLNERRQKLIEKQALREVREAKAFYHLDERSAA